MLGINNLTKRQVKDREFETQFFRSGYCVPVTGGKWSQINRGWFFVFQLSHRLYSQPQPAIYGVGFMVPNGNVQITSHRYKNQKVAKKVRNRLVNLPRRMSTSQLPLWATSDFFNGGVKLHYCRFDSHQWGHHFVFSTNGEPGQYQVGYLDSHNGSVETFNDYWHSGADAINYIKDTFD